MSYKFCTIVLLISFFSLSSYSTDRIVYKFDFEEEDVDGPALEFLKEQDFQKSIKYLCDYRLVSVDKEIDYRYPLLQKDLKDIANILINKQNKEKRNTFDTVINETGLDSIESLFLNDLPELAIEIINNIDQNSLKEEWRILKSIAEGQTDINMEKFDKKFLLIAYKVANNSNNIEMVKKLYKISGAHEMQNRLKNENTILFSDEVNYIHKPFWSDNIFELQEYASEMVEEMKPLFISEDEIEKTEKGSFIKNKEGQQKRVREVPFSYVFPNIFLKRQLLKLKDESRAVPEIFIARRDLKKPTVDFIFKLPASSSGESMKDFSINGVNDVGSNLLTVDSGDFVVYQEYVDGEGYVNDQTFSTLGHSDFNAIQVIRSKNDRKKYLIDTKDEKNFFAPTFFPFTEKFCDVCKDLAFCKKGYGERFDKKSAQKIVMISKSINFDLRKKFIPITVELK